VTFPRQASEGLDKCLALFESAGMRRQFLVLGLGAALVACGDEANNETAGPGTGSGNGSSPDMGIGNGEVDMGAPLSVSFDHGVASGDPLDDAVVLWTRVTPTEEATLDVAWELSGTEDFQDVVASGSFTTGAARDYTVKVDATGLDAGSTYFYRFSAEGETSPVGRTKTLPVGMVDEARFAVVSCSNFPTGFFNVYGRIAARQDTEDDYDAVLHLGDYFYEYAPGQFGDAMIDARRPDPENETISLSDYRTRHAQYKSDPDAQAMHGAYPMIAIWDDHEAANNAYLGGGQNHTEGEEGAWEDRVAAAIQAYYEWMPIRDPGMGGALFRRFQYGQLLTLHMLDTRLEARSQQLDYAADLPLDPANQTPAEQEMIVGSFVQQWLNPQRTLLGQAQEDFLTAGFQLPVAAQWQLVGNQVMMGQLYNPMLPNPINDPQIDQANALHMLGESLQGQTGKQNFPFSLDAWDGYPPARDRMLDIFELAQNVVVVTGDFHNAWALDLARDGDLLDGYDPATEAIAAEFVVPSVTSPGFEAALPEAFLGTVLNAIQTENRHIEYADLSERGFLDIEFTMDEATSTFVFVPDISERSEAEVVGQSFTVNAGQAGIARPF